MSKKFRESVACRQHTYFSDKVPFEDVNKKIPHILKCADDNFFCHIEKDEVHGDKRTWANTTSSQVACLNHLWCVSHSKEAVSAIANGLTKDHDFDDILPLTKDGRYIDFEVTGGNPLHEKGRQTSIDALIVAKNKTCKKYTIIVFEWKYAESYNGKTDRSVKVVKKKDKNGNPQEYNRGKTIMETYNSLIQNSALLVHLGGGTPGEQEEAYRSSVYYLEPFYQLMRQTLWIENIDLDKYLKGDSKDKFVEWDVSDKDYLYVHVIPKENKDLSDFKYPIDEKYKISDIVKDGPKLGTGWKKMLEYPERYMIVGPEDLLQPVIKKQELHNKYSELIKYLTARYW